jgi:hypothetical protein
MCIVSFHYGEITIPVYDETKRGLLGKILKSIKQQIDLTEKDVKRFMDEQNVQQFLDTFNHAKSISHSESPIRVWI